MLFNVDIRPIKVFHTANSANKAIASNKCIEELTKLKDGNIIVVQLPNISMYSAIGKTLLEIGVDQFPLIVAPSMWSEEKTTFPWNFHLVDFGCHTLQKCESLSFIDPITTNITLAISSKTEKDLKLDEEQLDLSICFHIDTSPINLYFYRNQVREKLFFNRIRKILLFHSFSSFC